MKMIRITVCTLSFVLFLGAVSHAQGLVGFWGFDEGFGDMAVNSGGQGNNATIANINNGLGDNGSVWVNDPERGSVIGFAGEADSAYGLAGDAVIPVMAADVDFTWAFWAKQAEGNGDNEIIFGNRMGVDNADFTPRQFIKFTPTKFEWHMNGNGDDNLDYEDIPNDVWIHHAVVKRGDLLTYYRDGAEGGTQIITQRMADPQPLYLGGDNQGSRGEKWAGYLDNARIYNRALSAGEIAELHAAESMADKEDGWPVNAVKLASGQTIVIDGDVSAGEYAGAQALVMNEFTLTGADPYFPNMIHNGSLHPAGSTETMVDDYNATYYFMWDDDYFYAAMEVVDDNYSFAGPDPNGADTLQFIFAEVPDITDTTQMFIPTVSPEDANLEPIFKNAFPGWIESIDLMDVAEFDGKSQEPDAGNWEIELRIPWSAMTGAFANEVFPPSAGDMIGFQVLAIDYDAGALEWFGTNHPTFPWDAQGVERIYFIDSVPTDTANWPVY